MTNSEIYEKIKCLNGYDSDIVETECRIQHQANTEEERRYLEWRLDNFKKARQIWEHWRRHAEKTPDQPHRMSVFPISFSDRARNTSLESWRDGRLSPIRGENEEGVVRVVTDSEADRFLGAIKEEVVS